MGRYDLPERPQTTWERTFQQPAPAAERSMVPSDFGDLPLDGPAGWDEGPRINGGSRPRIEVTCLGKFQVTIDGQPVTQWKSSKARALFQYLVNHHDRPITPDTLIEALWPDPNAAAPATSLKVAIHGLRLTLTALSKALPLAIIAHNPGYSLATREMWLDVEEFEQAYLTGRALDRRGLTEEALMLYRQAAEVYRGDYLEELADEWPSFRRETLKDQYLFVVTQLARAAVEQADYQGGVVWCQQILSKDRCREDVYQLLFQCHARLGQRGRVRQWYEFCVRSLEVELDCAPSPETDEAFRLALAGKL